jgi:O-antigen/teichoic acid export membrane protein
LKRRIKNIIKEDNFLSLSGNLVIAFFGIAGFALLARTLTVDLFGEWVLFITAGSFIEMFRFGITNTGLIRFLSGADKLTQISLKGSNAIISLSSTILISLILLGCNFFFHQTIENSGYQLFFTWYPLLALINLPWNNALVLLQADRQYGKILLLKVLNSGSFFILLLLSYYSLNLSLQAIITTFLIINAVTSAISMLAGWDGIKYIFKATKKSTATLLHFGKYTTFTLVGTNLLRSADTFILSLSPLGNAAVALYSIPLKLTELQQIPLRSFAATAFPKMSKASLQGKKTEVRELFYSYAGALTYLFIFISLFTFVFADYFILILAGKQYLHTDPATGFNVVSIVRIFSIYGLLLPIDRMTGIALDSINRPNINALKVFFMVISNVIGDIVAIFIFKSLLLVAVSSILFTLVGIWLGFFFLTKELDLRFTHIFSSGINFYTSLSNKLLKSQSSKKINVGINSINR